MVSAPNNYIFISSKYLVGWYYSKNKLLKFRFFFRCKIADSMQILLLIFHSNLRRENILYNGKKYTYWNFISNSERTIRFGENRHVHVVLWIYSSVSGNRLPSLLLHISLSAFQDACIASLQNCWLFSQPAWSRLSTRSSRSPRARNRKWQWVIAAPFQDRGA